ncbi:MAG: hypothetical protein J6U51_01060 [Bacteroidales bacterium]|nr:hypothetical protein [Bacteroidales bacterium]
MRTVTYKLLTFNELSEEAKDKAIENVRERVAEVNQSFVNDDYNGGLKDLEDAMDIKILDADVDAWSFRFRFATNGRWADLDDEPRFLCRYLNRLADKTWAGKFYTNYSKTRTSKVLFSDWEFCGMWFNRAFSKEMDSRFEYVKCGFTIRQFVDSVLTEYFTTWKRDLDYCYSDDAVVDTIIANEYEFLEDGSFN